MNSGSTNTLLTADMISLPHEVIGQTKLEAAPNRLIKRSVDILLGGFLSLLILPWLIPLLAIIIKLEVDFVVFFRYHDLQVDTITFCKRDEFIHGI